MTRRHGAVLLLAALWLVLGASGVDAQSPGVGAGIGGLGVGDDKGKPVGIEAEQGIEWQQNNHVYIARGNVKATRGEDTLLADTLYAYYRAAPGAGEATKPGATAAPGKNGHTDPLVNGSTEIYRIEADGNVRFTTPSQTAYGDHAVYDVDQAVLVMTGKALKLETPRDVITARDSLEWYDHKQLGVARGNALAVRETKKIRGDVLTALIEKPPNAPSHVSKINGSGNVIVTSLDQIARGDGGVYNVDTGIATLSGHVTLTRGDNELRGQYAVVDLNKNISRLLSAPPSTQLTGSKPARVQGMIVPRSRPSATPK